MHAYAVCEYVCVSVGSPYSDTVHRFCFFVVVGITSMSATLRVLGITLRALLMQQVLYGLYHLLALKLKF